jgi:V/A-type H+-transporting ATPase subunit E
MSRAKIDNKMIDKAIEHREKILEDAKKNAENIRKKAEAERNRINDVSNKSIEGIIGSELRAVHDRIVGRAQLEGRRKVLEARMEVLNKVYEQAQKEIKNIAAGKHADYDYDDTLLKLIEEADLGMGDTEYVINANKKDLEYLKINMDSVSIVVGGKKLFLSEKPADIIGGVIVANTNGTKSMENTLEGRLEAANHQLQSEIAEKLGVI